MKTRALTGIAVLILGSALLSACGTQAPAPPPDTRAADEAAIRRAAEEWAKTVPAKDAAKFVTFYAPDAAVYPFGAPKITGAENIRKYWSDFLGAPNLVGGSVSFTHIEAARSGDLAYETGTFELTTKDSKGKPITEVGKYVVVWKKQPDGQWKAVADIFNTDK